MKPRLLLAALLLAGCASGPRATQTIRALYVTGGPFHEYEKHAPLLTEGIARHAPVEWTVRWGPEALRDSALGEGFDVVVYNVCFRPKEEDLVPNVMRAIREGNPAVLIHCVIHCFNDNADWGDCCGLDSRHHDKRRAVNVRKADPDHPILRFWPDEWTSSSEELYQVAGLAEDSRPLLIAFSPETKKAEVVAWVCTRGKGRIFGTTLGHGDATVSQECFHKLLADGLLWAVGRLCK